VFFFVIGAIAISAIVLGKRLNCLVFILGLLGWAVIASWITMLGVFSCGGCWNIVYCIREPCPTLPLLSFPLQIEWSLNSYRCLGCVGYDIQIWLGGLWCWEGVSPALTGTVAQVSWLTQVAFPWLLWLAVFEVLVVFGVVWGAKSAFPWFRRALVLVVV
jgi:hypothetical protein